MLSQRPLSDTSLSSAVFNISAALALTQPSSAFSRPTQATYFDYTGTLQTASANVSRYGFDPGSLLPVGEITEYQSTNLIAIASLQASGWYAEGAATLTYPTGILNPFGLSQVSMIQGTGTNQAEINNYAKITLTSGIPYTISCYMKAGTSNYGYIRFNDGSANNYGVLYNLSNGTYVGSLTGGVAPTAAGVQALTNGWYRVWATYSSTSTGGYYTARFGVADTSSLTIFNANASGNAYFFGGQVEASASVSSFIYSQGSQTTRAADTGTAIGAAITLPTTIGLIQPSSAFALTGNWLLLSGALALKQPVSTFSVTDAEKFIVALMVLVEQSATISLSGSHNSLTMWQPPVVNNTRKRQTTPALKELRQNAPSLKQIRQSLPLLGE